MRPTRAILTPRRLCLGLVLIVTLVLVYAVFVAPEYLSYEDEVELRRKNGFIAFPTWYEFPSSRKEVTYDSWRTGLWNIKV